VLDRGVRSREEERLPPRLRPADAKRRPPALADRLQALPVTIRLAEVLASDDETVAGARAELGISELGLVPFVSHLATDTIFVGRRRSYIGADWSHGHRRMLADDRGFASL
jgi:hypothetical protein